jgi:chemotaxis methyl-accepting protein methylase
MLDPEFDPLQELRQAQFNVQQLQRQINEITVLLQKLITAHNSQAQLLQQLTLQNTELLRDLAVLRTFSQT